MLSKMLADAVAEVTEDMSQDDLEVMLESIMDLNPELVDLVDEGWILDEAIDHLDSLQEFKVPSPKEVAGRKKAKSRSKSSKNLRVGNPGNNPFSNYGVTGKKGGSGGKRHRVFGAKRPGQQTGEWSCNCKNYTCKCTSSKRKNRKGGPMVKTFTIDKANHLKGAPGAMWKASGHSKKEHPHSR
jgi:hypothetical protein